MQRVSLRRPHMGSLRERVQGVSSNLLLVSPKDGFGQPAAGWPRERKATVAIARAGRVPADDRSRTHMLKRLLPCWSPIARPPDRPNRVRSPPVRPAGAIAFAGAGGHMGRVDWRQSDVGLREPRRGGRLRLPKGTCRVQKAPNGVHSGLAATLPSAVHGGPSCRAG